MIDYTMQISNTPYPFVYSEYAKITGSDIPENMTATGRKKIPKDKTDLHERSCVVCSLKDPPNG